MVKTKSRQEVSLYLSNPTSKHHQSQSKTTNYEIKHVEMETQSKRNNWSILENENLLVSMSFSVLSLLEKQFNPSSQDPMMLLLSFRFPFFISIDLLSLIFFHFNGFTDPRG